MSKIWNISKIEYYTTNKRKLNLYQLSWRNLQNTLLSDLNGGKNGQEILSQSWGGEH